jgi:uncharacterized protein
MLDSQMTGIMLPVPPLPEKRVWGAWASLGYSAVILTAFFFIQFIVILIGLIIIMKSQDISFDPGNITGFLKVITDTLNSRMGLIQSIATIISGIAGVLLIWVFVRARNRAGFGEYLSLHKISVRAVWLAVGATIALIGLSSLIQSFLGMESGDEITYNIYNTSVWPVLFGIAVVIFAPLFEEALFRGFLFEGLRQSRLGVLGAVVITSITWAALHIQYNLFGMAYIFVLGIAIGLIRWKTKTIWSGFIMHALVNLIATVSVAVTAHL